MVPVEQAKRHVTVLLNLEDYDTAAQRVHHASRIEDSVARIRMEARRAVRHRPSLERRPQNFRSGAWLQSSIDTAFYPSFQHNPPFSIGGRRIRWMHLHREHFLNIEELQLQRKRR